MTTTPLELVVGPLDAVPLGEGRTFTAYGEKIAVFRTRANELYAVQAQCPHRGGPLADGLLGGTAIICPLHSWKFDLKTGEGGLENCQLRTYAVRTDAEGRIVLTLEGTRT